jgi:hypothetical protein
MAESCSPEDMLSPGARESTTRGFTNHDHRSAADDVRRFEQFDTFFRIESRIARLQTGSCTETALSWRVIAEYQIERIQLETRIALKPTVEDSNGLIAEC